MRLKINLFKHVNVFIRVTHSCISSMGGLALCNYETPVGSLKHWLPLTNIKANSIIYLCGSLSDGLVNKTLYKFSRQAKSIYTHMVLYDQNFWNAWNPSNCLACSGSNSGIWLCCTWFWFRLISMACSSDTSAGTLWIWFLDRSSRSRCLRAPRPEGNTVSWFPARLRDRRAFILLRTGGSCWILFPFRLRVSSFFSFSISVGRLAEERKHTTWGRGLRVWGLIEKLWTELQHYCKVNEQQQSQSERK